MPTAGDPENEVFEKQTSVHLAMHDAAIRAQGKMSAYLVQQAERTQQAQLSLRVNVGGFEHGRLTADQRTQIIKDILWELNIDERDAINFDPYNMRGRLGTVARFDARTTYAEQRIIAHYFQRYPGGVNVDTPAGNLKIWLNKADWMNRSSSFIL